MTVERHLVGFRRLGDRIDADAADAVLAKQFAGRRNYTISRRLTGLHTTTVLEPYICRFRDRYGFRIFIDKTS